MTTESIQKVQALLTVSRNGDRKKKIIDVEVLLKRHKAESVISLLEAEMVFNLDVITPRSNRDISQTSGF